MYITRQRVISSYPDVAIGIEEIMKDLFIKDNPFRLTVSEDSDVKDKIFELFNEFKKDIPFNIETNLKTNNKILLSNIIKQIYVDGVCYIKPIYKDKKVRFTMLNPLFMNYSNDDNNFSYLRVWDGLNRDENFDFKDLVVVDFGLADWMGVRFGYLNFAYKYANQLYALQDMLIPMRFKRSVSRRIFNVDVSELPLNRVNEIMNRYMNSYKYNKMYVAEEGVIKTKNGSEIGLVEDYWFPSRNGSKGTNVELLDESGSFTDSLEDITYFNKKLYQAMFIPLRRVFESDSQYDYTSNSIEIDEIRFSEFLTKLRFVYDELFLSLIHI